MNAYRSLRVTDPEGASYIARRIAALAAELNNRAPGGARRANPLSAPTTSTWRPDLAHTNRPHHLPGRPGQAAGPDPARRDQPGDLRMNSRQIRFAHV